MKIHVRNFVFGLAAPKGIGAVEVTAGCARQAGQTNGVLKHCPLRCIATKLSSSGGKHDTCGS